MAKKDDVVAWKCTECGESMFPEQLFASAMQSVSGIDVVTVGHCPCGNSALLSWTVKAWNHMHKARQQQLRERESLDEHRRDSEIGRKVAEFRRQLETVDTLDEMGLLT